ncbi:MAG: hypothetical protein KIT43_03480 [Bauldia sp.]|nr:hypothetical protein [Bauldia sp.]
MRTKGLLAFAVATATLSGSALAADVISPVVFVPPPVVIPVAPTVAGYIDLHFGILRGFEDFYFDESYEGTDYWRSLVLGGGGRGAYELTQALNIQLDAWFNFIVNPDRRLVASVSDGYANFGRGGIGGHIFVDTAGGLYAGALATVGVVTDYGMFANVGAEVAQSFGNFTVSIQGGYTFGILGEPAFDGHRSMYVRAGGTFYVGPNTSVAANVGFSRTRIIDEAIFGRELSWGARVEHKLGSSPFTIFGAYEGYRWAGYDADDPFSWNGMEHAFVVGVRMLFGRDTLQALDAAVPFADYNPIYGDPFIR